MKWRVILKLEVIPLTTTPAYTLLDFRQISC